ncbi:MAG TPA: dTMP kinase [Nitrososphaeraceae archaeon]|jgi:dTMP kinase|nr:dTMP kinase [Nitrososphaeraceae archaeon]
MIEENIPVEHNKKFEVKGKLIVVEGIDGSGKSTQIHLLRRWLISEGLPVFMTEWNSSEIVKEITSKGKKKARLTPTTFSILHATDFADRYERNIFPLLRAGYIVLADRYVYTAYARDVVRGCSPTWIRNVYSFALKPNIVFYFRVAVDTAIERIMVGRPKLKYYEAGMDLDLSNDPYDSYRIFQSRIIDQYESMVQSEGFTVIDGTSGIEEQQQLVRNRVNKILSPKRQEQAAISLRKNYIAHVIPEQTKKQ